MHQIIESRIVIFLGSKTKVYQLQITKMICFMFQVVSIDKFCLFL